MEIHTRKLSKTQDNDTEKAETRDSGYFVVHQRVRRVGTAEWRALAWEWAAGIQAGGWGFSRAHIAAREGKLYPDSSVDAGFMVLNIVLA